MDVKDLSNMQTIAGLLREQESHKGNPSMLHCRKPYCTPNLRNIFFSAVIRLVFVRNW